MTPHDIKQAVQKLTDEELQELVSILSSDYTDYSSSTMEAMVYAFNTSRHHIANRDDSLRVQAHLYS